MRASAFTTKTQIETSRVGAVGYIFHMCSCVVFVIIIFNFHFFFFLVENKIFSFAYHPEKCVYLQSQNAPNKYVCGLCFFSLLYLKYYTIAAGSFCCSCCCCLLLLLNAVEAICFRLGFNYFETKMHMGNDTFTNHLNCLYSTAMGRIIFSFGTGLLSNIWFNSAVHAHPNDGSVERDHSRNGRDNWDCTDHCLCWCVAKVDFTVYQLESNCGTFQRFHGLEFVWRRLYSCSSCAYYFGFNLFLKIELNKSYIKQLDLRKKINFFLF